jgi:hypothetical protein
VPAQPSPNHRSVDVDALARDLVEGFMRFDIVAPPFPAYYAAWAERDFGEIPPDQRAALRADAPPIDSLQRMEHRVAGDLEAFVYRAEPDSSALFLAVRSEEVAYLAFAAGLYAVPQPHRGFTFRQLAMFAVSVRAETVGVRFSGLSGGGGEAARVNIDVDRAGYEALDEPGRRALYARCEPIARDVGLLLGDGSAVAPILAFYEPAPDGAFTTGSGRPKLIAEVALS